MDVRILTGGLLAAVMTSTNELSPHLTRRVTGLAFAGTARG